MSRQTARIVLDQLSGRPALIAPRYAGQGDADHPASLGMLADLRELAQADLTLEQARFQDRKPLLAAAYGYRSPDLAKPFAFADGKAIIPIHGILINRFPYSWSFATGYTFIRNQVEAALADDDVDGIIYDVNSYGGTVAGCEETCDAVYAASKVGGGKPSVAVVDANCFSAAYMLASNADKLYVTPSGEAGSIGVVQMHIDLSSALEQAGVKISFQYAGSHKIDGNPFAPLSDAAKADRQAKIDASMDMFVSKVVRGRKLTDKQVRDTEALCYLAEDALKLGLIDGIKTPDAAVEAFMDEDAEIEDDDEDFALAPETVTEQGTNMPTPTNNTSANNTTAPDTTAAQAAAAASEARTAERNRIAAITGHAEAKDRAKLASHLALETDMTADQAGKVLAAAAKETGVEATSNSKDDTNHFENAMNNSKQPNVGAGNGDGGAQNTEASMTPAQRVLAAQRKASGRKPTPVVN